jgi:electron transfer flavoprotein beta subunit
MGHALMKIICLIKIIPDPESFQYDYDNNILIREKVKLIVNPADACALAYALELKQKQEAVTVEIVSMTPLSSLNLIRDLLRRGADYATVLSDGQFSGSDTYVTSHILAEYLKRVSCDLILSGNHSLDGNTSHVPSQVAELLGLNQMSDILSFEKNSGGEKQMTVIVESDSERSCYRISLPALFSVSQGALYKLPFVPYASLELDVDDRITIVSNRELKIPVEQLGTRGSPTKVIRTWAKKLETKKHIVVQNDEEGIETVYQFLKSKGFL